MVIRSGIVLFSLELINRPGEIVTFLKLETFQVDKARELSKRSRCTITQLLNLLEITC